MPIFEFQAINDEGKTVRGTEVGADLGSVAAVLAQRGLSVQSLQQSLAYGEEPPKEVEVKTGGRIEVPRYTSESITEQRSYVATDLMGPIFGKVALPHLQFFFKQAAIMLRAGINPVEAFHTLAGQTQSPKLREIILEMEEHARAGRPMSAGLQRYPEVFTPVMVSLVRVGERMGNVDGVLEQISDYVERELHLRRIVKKATIYPKIVVVCSVLILGVANSIIQAIKPGSNVQLTNPLMTVALWLILGPVLVGLFLFLRVGLQNPRIKHNWDMFNANIPYIGPTIRQLAMAKFGRAMGALYRGGVPIHEAFQLAADSCGNEWLRSEMYPAFKGLETGAGLTETLRSTGAFNPIVLDMTSTGERTGNLDQMLEKMAEFYEAEAEVRSVQVAMLTGVAILLIVAIFVGYIYITNMSQILGGGVRENL